jgi:hypothetical protein
MWRETIGMWLPSHHDFHMSISQSLGCAVSLKRFYHESRSVYAHDTLRDFFNIRVNG